MPPRLLCKFREKALPVAWRSAGRGLLVSLASCIYGVRYTGRFVGRNLDALGRNCDGSQLVEVSWLAQRSSHLHTPFFCTFTRIPKSETLPHYSLPHNFPFIPY